MPGTRCSPPEPLEAAQRYSHEAPYATGTSPTRRRIRSARYGPPPTAAEARLGSRTDVAFPSPARERHHLPKPAFWASEGLTRPPGLARLPRVGRGDWAVCRRDVTWR